jgi:hypothetical protein
LTSAGLRKADCLRPDLQLHGARVRGAYDGDAHRRTVRDDRGGDPHHAEEQQGNRVVFELDMGFVIGEDKNNHDSGTLRSVWGLDGNLITAYPIEDKK